MGDIPLSMAVEYNAKILMQFFVDNIIEIEGNFTVTYNFIYCTYNFCKKKKIVTSLQKITIKFVKKTVCNFSV